MRYFSVVVAIVLGVSGCQPSSQTDDYESYLGDIDLADFVGRWTMPSPSGLVRFDIRRGSDGRYFGHALAEGFSPMTVLYADESAFSKIFGWWDRDGDNEWSESDLETRCDVLSYDGRSDAGARAPPAGRNAQGRHRAHVARVRSPAGDRAEKSSQNGAPVSSASCAS